MDASTDLPVVLEQLPEPSAAITNDERAGALDFYEQGIQRRLEFRRRRQLIET